MFFGYDSTIILLIPAIIFSMIAQAKVQSTLELIRLLKDQKTSDLIKADILLD